MTEPRQVELKRQPAMSDPPVTRTPKARLITVLLVLDPLAVPLTFVASHGPCTFKA
jgi:hypothetical protein